MNIIELFVRRRVLAYMLSAALLLFGFIGLRGVGLDRLPNVNPPMITVTTVNPGASPEVMDASVSSVLESAVNAVACYCLGFTSVPYIHLTLPTSYPV